jgi:hypothetical protein
VQVRLSHFDPDVFYKFKQVFIDKGPHASEKQQDDVRHDVAKVTNCNATIILSEHMHLSSV